MSEQFIYKNSIQRVQENLHKQIASEHKSKYFKERRAELVFNLEVQYLLQQVLHYNNGQSWQQLINMLDQPNFQPYCHRIVTQQYIINILNNTYSNRSIKYQTYQQNQHQLFFNLIIEVTARGILQPTLIHLVLLSFTQILASINQSIMHHTKIRKHYISKILYSLNNLLIRQQTQNQTINQLIRNHHFFKDILLNIIMTQNQDLVTEFQNIKINSQFTDQFSQIIQIYFLLLAKVNKNNKLSLCFSIQLKVLIIEIILTTIYTQRIIDPIEQQKYGIFVTKKENMYNILTAFLNESLKFTKNRSQDYNMIQSSFKKLIPKLISEMLVCQFTQIILNLFNSLQLDNQLVQIIIQCDIMTTLTIVLLKKMKEQSVRQEVYYQVIVLLSKIVKISMNFTFQSNQSVRQYFTSIGFINCINKFIEFPTESSTNFEEINIYEQRITLKMNKKMHTPYVFSALLQLLELLIKKYSITRFCRMYSQVKSTLNKWLGSQYYS